MPKGQYARGPKYARAAEPQQDWVSTTTPEDVQYRIDHLFNEIETNSFKAVIGRNVIGKITDKDVRKFEYALTLIDAGRWAVNNHLYLPSSGNFFTFEGHEYLKEVYSTHAPYIVLLKGAQLGMALKLDTPILTTNGWKTMGTICVGDRVYGSDGIDYPVTNATEVMHGHKCYRMTLCDKTEIIADAGHKWVVRNVKYNTLKEKTTEQLSKTFKMRKDQRSRYAIPVCEPIEGVEKELPINPYVLGLWLGDGNSYSAQISAYVDDANMYSRILADLGVKHILRNIDKKQPNQYNVFFPGLHLILKANNLLKNKHIPDMYLTASYQQRLELLRGLMDTDGHIRKDGYAEFYNVNTVLLNDVFALISTLGFKPHIRNKGRQLCPGIGRPASGKMTQEIYVIGFQPGNETNIATLHRKFSNQKAIRRPKETASRYISQIEEVESTPVRCISVGSPDHLYLVTRAMVPTHNSEWCVISSLHDCAYRLKSGLIYYFPTYTHVLRFSKSRFNPMIKANPILQNLVRNTNSADIKQIGNCTLHFFGLRGPMGAKTTPADKLVFDEEDEVEDPTYVDMAHKRMAHSEFQEEVHLSTPTIPEFGVDDKFLNTDQRYRMMFCEGCRKYTCMEEEFPESLIMTSEGAKRVCTKCKRELNLSHPKNEYVAKFPGKEFNGRPAVGFCVSQLHSRYVSMDEIWNEYLTTKYPQDFWNQRLARAYIEVQNRMEVAHVIAMCKEHGLDQTSKVPTCIGVDVGPKTHHIVVGRKEYGGSVRIVYIGETKPNHDSNPNEAWDDLKQIIQKFDGYMVLDGLPEPKKALNFTKDHPYRAWACFYSNSPATGMRWNDDEKKITVYQSMAMDASHQMLQDGKVILPRKSDLIMEFAKHCHNVARKKIEDRETGSVYNKWIKTGADHYRKAFSYMCLAMERTPESKYSGRDYSYLDGTGGVGRTSSSGDLASSYA